nr:cyanophycin synthetase [Legionella tunisiensis]
MAACALAAAAGIKPDYMINVLKTFTGLPHRCQWVRTLDEIDWINDSKGTNIGATISAISGIGGSMQGKIVLIAGGQGKGADFTELRPPVAEHVRSVVLIGEDADKIEHALANVIPILRATSLEDAVIMAKSQARSGDVVLLSPACASLDMFRDFNHRGEVFANLVSKL